MHLVHWSLCSNYRMYKTGLLLLTQPLHIAKSQSSTVLQHILNKVKERLYVHLLPSVMLSQLPSRGQMVVPCVTSALELVTQYYSELSKVCYPATTDGVCDMRILLANISNKRKTIDPQVLNEPFQVVYMDQVYSKSDTDKFRKYVHDNFMCKGTVSSDVHFASIPDVEKNTDVSEVVVQKTFNSVCVGGTFDRIHIGHKILLSQTCLLGEDKITVGVTDESMLNKKVLNDMIQPTDVRIKDVLDLLSDIKPGIEHYVVPISDPFGPSIVDPDIEAIVVSEETLKGGQMVNDKRNEKGMKALDIHTILLVEDACHSQYEENKVSSSSGRKRLLGTLLKQPQYKEKNLSASPYIIGLTGGIASGKSSVCKRLEKLGAFVVDCDKLGHKAYVKGTAAFRKIVETFGSEVVGEDGEINRKVLGPKVFSSKAELHKLNEIVWPAIADLAQQQIQDYIKQGAQVVILDAAVLLEAGWDNMTHEVWATFVPKEEAVKRIMDRNKLPEDQALKRIESQISNQVRLSSANVAICTLWEYEYTQQQVEKAWKLLQKRSPFPVKSV